MVSKRFFGFLFGLALASTSVFAQSQPTPLVSYAGGGAGTTPSAPCGDSSHALAWNGTAYICQAITGTAAAGGSNTQAQYNNLTALAGISGQTSDGTNTFFGDGTLKLTGGTSGTAILKAPATGGGTVILPGGSTTIGAANNNLGFFASTTSAQLAGVLSDETGTGAAVFATNPVFVTPNLGTPSALIMANATGTPASIGLANGTGLSLATGVTGTLPLANGGTNCPGTTGTPSATTFLEGDCKWATPAGSGSVSVTASTPNVVITPSPGTGTFTIGTTAASRTVTIASDTLQSGPTGDCGKTVQYTNTSGTVTVSLPTTATMGTGCSFTLSSGPVTSASPLTVTPVAGSSVMWQGTLYTTAFTIPANTAAFFSTPNGTNWETVGGTPIVATSSVQGIASWGTGLGITAGVGSVTNPSPASSTTNDILTFSNTTGALQDSGTLLSSLAPKASPTFTGTATAAALTTTGQNTLSALGGGGTLCLHANNSGVISTTSTDCPASASSGGGTLNYSDNGVTLTANTYFIPPGGGGIPQTTEANVSVKSPAAMTITNLQVSLSADPGAGQTLAVTLRKGGSDQTLTCTITGGSGATCQDVTHSVNLALNDVIDWKVVTTGTYVATPTVTITAANGTSQVGVTSVSGGTGVSVATGSTTPVVSLAAIAADSDISNHTGGSAAPVANSIPNCPTADTYNTTTHVRGCNPGQTAYVANYFYSLMTAPFGTSAVGSTTLTRLQPFYVAYPMTISQLCVHSIANAGNFNIGVYANDNTNNHATGSALTSTGTTANPNGSTNCASASYSFTAPGNYWCAVQVDNVTATFTGANGNGSNPAFMVGTSSSANVAGEPTWTYASTYGTMPTITSSSVTEGSGTSQPVCFAKVASVP